MLYINYIKLLVHGTYWRHNNKIIPMLKSPMKRNYASYFLIGYSLLPRCCYIILWTSFFQCSCAVVRTSLRPDRVKAFPRFRNVLSCVKPKSIYTRFIFFSNDVTHARLCKHWQYVKVFHSSYTFEIKLCLIKAAFHRFREGAAHTSKIITSLPASLLFSTKF